MTQKECVKDDELNHFLSKRAGTVERQAIEFHLSNCQGCRHRLIARHRESKAEEYIAAPGWLKSRVLRIPQESPVAAPDPIFGPRRHAAMAVAAVIVVALGITVFLMRDSFRDGRLPADDVVREEAGISAAPRLLAPTPGEQLSSGEIEFRWSEVQGAGGYTFTLLDEKGDIVFKASTEEGRLKLPASDARLEPGKAYFWYVGAKTPGGGGDDSEMGRFVFNRK